MQYNDTPIPRARGSCADCRTSNGPHVRPAPGHAVGARLLGRNPVGIWCGSGGRPHERAGADRVARAAATYIVGNLLGGLVFGVGMALVGI